MGLFDFFRKKVKSESPRQAKGVSSIIPETDKKYYQPDSYYTDKAFEGTPFEKKVITFEERKRTAIPSSRGLYPAEILLLEYCSKGTYPGPKNGYPGFWWFTYGIRDVGTALRSLEHRGFIAFGSVSDCVKGLTIQQLKELLATKSQPATGKKAELVARVVSVFSEEELRSAGVQAKYVLTEVGQQELTENAYVPYMHSVPNKTTEDTRFGMTFNVWSINKLLGTGDKSNWKSIVDEQAQNMEKESEDRHDSFMGQLKRIDPESYRALITQDQQIAAVQQARAKYDADKDLDIYIAFWEMVWANGGLKFEGAKWHFELPDLYIKAKRYDDALDFVIRIKKTKPLYAEKANAYIQKIKERKEKIK